MVKNNIVEINGLLINGYPGLVRNDTNSTNGKNYIIIENLVVRATNSSRLTANSGWIGQRYMNKGIGSTCQVINCYSTGAIIGTGAGGIFGQGSSGTSTNCYSTGDIIGTGDNALS